MRRHVGMAAVAIGLIGAAPGGAAEASPARPGQVVRIERPHRSSRDRVRLCAFAEPGKLVCVGNPPPARGQMIDLFEYEGGHQGRVRVLSSTLYVAPDGSCQQDNWHLVEFATAEDKRASSPAASGVVIGVSGVALDPARARLAEVGQQPAPVPEASGTPLFSLDADGDGQADFVVHMTSCSSGGGVSGGVEPPNCFEYWVRRGQWQRVGSDVFKPCF